MEALVGRTLGQGEYRLVARLGGGGMGAVYEAEQTLLRRRVAVKVLWPHLTHEPGLVVRFNREARIAARLEHPHILPVYGFGEERGLLYLVMRLVRGGSLKDRLRGEGPRRQGWSPQEALELARQALPPLDYAHRQGVVHRDLKPDNLLLEPSDEFSTGYRVFLSDFGIATLAQGDEVDSGLTQTGGALGTPAYMAPEQVLDQHVDGRADLYAFGVMLFEVLVGQVPYRGQTPLGVAMQHVRQPVPLPRELNPRLPASVEAVLLRALAKDRDDRFASGAALVEALAEAVEQSAVDAPPAPGAGRPAPSPPRRPRPAPPRPSPAPDTASRPFQPSETPAPAPDPPAPANEPPAPVAPTDAPVVDVRDTPREPEAPPPLAVASPAQTQIPLADVGGAAGDEATGVGAPQGSGGARRVVMLVGAALAVGLLALAAGLISSGAFTTTPPPAPPTDVPAALGAGAGSAATPPADPRSWVVPPADLGPNWSMTRQSTVGSTPQLSVYEVQYADPATSGSMGFSLFSASTSADADAGLQQLRQSAEARGVAFDSVPAFAQAQPALRGRASVAGDTPSVSIVYLFRVSTVAAIVEGIGAAAQEAGVGAATQHAAELQRDRLLAVALP